MTVESQDIAALTRFALEVIRQAGEKALSFYGKGKKSIKFDRSLVTETEIHLTDFFEVRLKEQFPEHRMFNHANELPAYTHDAKRYLWTFDAIDGVANFQAGIPIWSVSLALVENYWPVFGGIYMPATGDICYAVAGDKAFWNDEEICISEQPAISDESLLLTYSRFHHHYQTAFPGKIRNLGCTAAHLCYVAMGRAEGAVIANESFQDLAAARIIIEAAGGRIYKMNGEEFYLNEYLDGNRIEDHLLVAGPESLPQIRQSIRELAA